jgi:hypothetical protein
MFAGKVLSIQLDRVKYERAKWEKAGSTKRVAYCDGIAKGLLNALYVIECSVKGDLKKLLQVVAKSAEEGATK